MDVRELEKKYGRISVHLASKDRHSETAVCLASLRGQTYKLWDLVLLDDASGTPLTVHDPSVKLINRLKFEDHKIKMLRNDISQGVCAARNKIIDNDDFNNPLTLRIDDDCIYESDYFERLVKVLENGYHMASGIVPLVQNPEFEREIKFVEPIINKLEVDNEGNILKYSDDCGFSYLPNNKILLAPQFRTNLLYLSKINKQVRYEPNLSFTGFREEAFFSLRCLLLGYKLGIDTMAKSFHLQTNSGGCRSQNYSQNVALDHETFCKFLKEKVQENGNFLQRYYEENVK